MSGFEELRNSRKGKAIGCRVCGEAVAGTLQISLREANNGPHISSRSSNLCEKHASEIFVALRDELERRIQQ